MPNEIKMFVFYEVVNIHNYFFYITFYSYYCYVFVDSLEVCTKHKTKNIPRCFQNQK